MVEWLVTAAVLRCDYRLGCGICWPGERGEGQYSGQGRAGDDLKLLLYLWSADRAQECLTRCHSWGRPVQGQEFDLTVPT